MAGCATAPKPAPQLPGAECSQLRAEIARTEQEKRAALEKKENAWKVVIPFAVAAQYAAGKSAADSADKRLAELGNQSARQGCSS
jgi:hypothetical protein